MSNCPAHLTDPGEIKRCEKLGCRDRATCYHVYYYCEKHCPLGVGSQRIGIVVR